MSAIACENNEPMDDAQNYLAHLLHGQGRLPELPVLGRLAQRVFEEELSGWPQGNDILPQLSQNGPAIWPPETRKALKWAEERFEKITGVLVNGRAETPDELMHRLEREGRLPPDVTQPRDEAIREWTRVYAEWADEALRQAVQSLSFVWVQFPPRDASNLSSLALVSRLISEPERMVSAFLYLFREIIRMQEESMSPDSPMEHVAQKNMYKQAFALLSAIARRGLNTRAPEMEGDSGVSTATPAASAAEQPGSDPSGARVDKTGQTPHGKDLISAA